MAELIQLFRVNSASGGGLGSGGRRGPALIRSLFGSIPVEIGEFLSAMATTLDQLEQIKQRIEMIDPAAARDEIAAGVKVIDVREQHEWDEAHLAEAVHVPQNEVLERIEDVAPDRSERLILHCRTDNRSARVADLLEGVGYENVAVIRGGIVAWQEAGLPVVQPEG